MKKPVLITLLGLAAIIRPSAAQSTPAASAADTAGATAALLPDSEVAQAVELGKAKKNARAFGYQGKADCNGFMQDWLPVYGVWAQGPVARIASASADATRKYVSFGPADVSAEMRARTIAVGVQQAVKQWPDGSLKSEMVTVDHVVIRGLDENGEPRPPVQPTHVEPLPATWSNMMGGKVETKGMLATFDLRTLPAGELQVVVITAQRECRATIKEKDRAKIQ
jgi:hypothetical protein